MRYLLILLLCTNAYAGQISMPQYGETSKVDANGVQAGLNTRFNLTTNVINGGLDNNNANVDDGFRFIEILPSLPAPGNQGRVVFDTSNNTLNFDTGSEFVQTIVITGTPATNDLNYFGGSNWALLNIDTNKSRYLSNQGTSNTPDWQKVDLRTGVDIQGMTAQDLFFASNGTVIARLGIGSKGKFLRSSASDENVKWSSIQRQYELIDTQTFSTATEVRAQVTGFKADEVWKIVFEGVVSSADARIVITINSDETTNLYGYMAEGSDTNDDDTITSWTSVSSSDSTTIAISNAGDTDTDWQPDAQFWVQINLTMPLDDPNIRAIGYSNNTANKQISEFRSIGTANNITPTTIDLLRTNGSGTITGRWYTYRLSQTGI